MSKKYNIKAEVQVISLKEDGSERFEKIFPILELDDSTSIDNVDDNFVDNFILEFARKNMELSSLEYVDWVSEYEIDEVPDEDLS